MVKMVTKLPASETFDIIASMESMYDKVYGEMKEAMKAKNQQKVLLLRGVISAVKNATVNAGKEITDEAVLSAIKKTLKELDQSVESFSKAGRDAEVAKINLDRQCLSEFLPKQLGEDELKVLIAEVLVDLGPGLHSKKEMGKIMKEVMARAKGAADGKLVSKLVASVLV